MSRERAIDLGRKALSSGLLQSEDRMYLVSALAALAMAGEIRRGKGGTRAGDRVGRAERGSADRCRSPALERAGALRSGRAPARRARPDPRADPVLAGLDAARIPRGIPHAGAARTRRDRRSRAVDRRHLARQCRGCSPHPLRLRAGSTATRIGRCGAGARRLHRGRRSGRIGPVPQSCLRPVALAGGDCAAAARA